MHGKHEQPRPRTSAATVATVALAMLVLVLSVVLGQVAGSRRGVTDSPIPGATSGPAAQQLPQAAVAAPTTTRVVLVWDIVREVEQQCRLTNLRQQAAMSSAAVSLAQFQKHIDAMNLLVAGKISWAVANTFWEQTRIGAMEDIAAFRDADAAKRKAGTGCGRLAPDVASVAEPARASGIAACANAATGKEAVIRDAEIAVTTWEHHVHDMEKLRKGELTPSQASAAWQKSWKTGQAQIKTYEASLKQAATARCALG